VELTKKLLVSMGGWDVLKHAQAIQAAGRVVEASYEPPLMKGKIAEGGKEFFAGLKMRNPLDVENLCPCRDSRVRGIICAHSVAVGLEILEGQEGRPGGSIASNRREVVSGNLASPPGPRGASTSEVPSIELTLEGSLRHLEALIEFRYREPGVANPAREGAAMMRLMELGFEDVKGKAVLRGEESVVRFFAVGLPKLKQDWTVKEGERFQHVTKDIVRIEPQFAIRDKEDGWLDFQIHYSAGAEAVFTAAEVSQLLQTGGHVRLKNGQIAVADGTLARDLEEVLRDCNPEQVRGTYRVAAQNRSYLETSVAAWTGREADPRLAGKGGLGATLPTAMGLRPYQVEGAEWLLARAQSGLGGLLADEMGLGKTVQALAMVESLPGIILVVCPSSLVWNWRREAAHFLPELPVLTLDGPQREKRFAEIPKHRLVVTSYGLLRRDIAKYRDWEFSAVILDEAQHIKNPDSQNAKAACTLRARSRFILTGTPIENSLRDLWSLFEFLLPGVLGSRDDFKERYETPLLNGERGGVWERLARRTRPHFLRRLKRDILTELPDKIEQVLEVELTPEQKAVYTRLQEAARERIAALKDQGGAARMQVLTALLRLRQACCDLRLLGSPKPGSAKMTALLELLGEAVDGGHRVLVFSQFTSMLDLISEDLNEEGLAHCRLDGSTRNRGEVVDRFQNDPTIPVFLISLKAGGVGLNLTAADTVIHFDPWWNPAVEAQATDRAHRIGQKSVVTSIKLIARDTVEERVLRMQEKKRDLLDGMVDAESALEKFSVEELAEMVG